jgi:hypothetical protein
MHGGWQLFSPTLLVEVEGSLLIRWIALYALISVWRREERGKHTRARSLTLPRWARPRRTRLDRAWCGEAMGMGT